MSRTTPKPFQQTAIESGVQLFAECKRLLEVAPDDAASRAAAVSQHGILLLEAPTGAGKTLSAGHLVEQFSAGEAVVWFWFAPFKGVTGQTASVLRAELPGLRLRELTEDRQAGESRAGDVFVTTWQTVATKVKDTRSTETARGLLPYCPKFRYPRPALSARVHTHEQDPAHPGHRGSRGARADCLSS